MLAEVFVLLAGGKTAEMAAALSAVAPDFSKMAQLDEWEQSCLDAAKSGNLFPEPPAFLAEYALEF